MKYSDLVKKYSTFSKNEDEDEDEIEKVEEIQTPSASIDSLREKYNVGFDSSNFSNTTSVNNEKNYENNNTVFNAEKEEEEEIDYLKTYNNYLSDSSYDGYLTSSQKDLTKKNALSDGIETEYSKENELSLNDEVAIEYENSLKEQEEKWLNSDAYEKQQEENKNKSIPMTILDVLIDLGYGAADASSGIAKIGASGLSWLGEKTGIEWLSEQGLEISSSVDALSSSRENSNEVMEEYSYLPQDGTFDSVMETVGQVSLYILSGNLSSPSTAIKVTTSNSALAKIGTVVSNSLASGSTKVMVATVATNSYFQAKDEGASDTEAVVYGILSAGSELGIELLSGGTFASIFGKGAVDDIVQNYITENISSEFLQKLSKYGVSVVSEGLEEVAADIVNPFIQLVYKDELDFPTFSDLLETFTIGALASSILGIPSINTISGVSEQKVEANKTVIDKLESIDKSELTPEQTSKLETEIVGLQNGTIDVYDYMETFVMDWADYTDINSNSNVTENSNENETKNYTNDITSDTAEINTNQTNGITDIELPIDEIANQTVEQNFNNNSTEYTIPDAKIIENTFGVDNISAILSTLSSENATIGTIVENIQNKFETNEINSEVVNNAIEELKDNSEFINALKSYNPTLFDQIYGVSSNNSSKTYSETKERTTQNIASESNNETNTPDNSKINNKNFRDMTTEELINLDKSSLTEKEISEVNQILLDRNVTSDDFKNIEPNEIDFIDEYIDTNTKESDIPKLVEEMGVKKVYDVLVKRIGKEKTEKAFAKNNIDFISDISENTEIENNIEKNNKKLEELNAKLESELDQLNKKFDEMQEDIDNRLNEVPIESYSEQEKRNSNIQDLDSLKSFIKNIFKRNNVNQIINEIEENGISSAIEKYAKKTTFTDENLKNLKKEIKKTKLNISNLSKSFKDYIKNAFGSMRLGNTGMDIDVYYEELKSEYPDLLPEVNSLEEAFVNLYEISKKNDTITESVMDNQTAFNYMYDEIDSAYNSYKLAQEQNKINEEIDSQIEFIEKAIEFKNTKGKIVKPIKKVEPVNLKPSMTYGETADKISKEDAERLSKEKTPDNLVAKIYSSMPQKKSKDIIEKLKKFANKTRQDFVDIGNAVRNLAKEFNAPELLWAYDNSMLSNTIGDNVVSEYQSDSRGHKIGDSVEDIMKPLVESGKIDEFSQYAVEKLNIDRMSLEDKALQKIIDFEKKNFDIVYKIDENGEIIPRTRKEIRELKTKKAKQYLKLIETHQKTQNKTATGRSAIESKEIVDRLEIENHEFKEISEKISKFYENELDLAIEAGLVKPEFKKIFRELYPNYIRIQRDFGSTSGNSILPKTARINSPNIKAKGGTQNILPIFETMAQYAKQNRNAIAKNNFGKILLELSGGGVETEITVGTEILTEEEIIKKVQDKYYYTVFLDGKAYTMEMNEDMYEAVKGIEISPIEDNFAFKFLQKASKLFKKAIIDYNPMYTVKNIFRDLGDAPLNSKFPLSYYKNLPIAIKMIATNDITWQQYKALGGMGNTYYDSEKGFSLPKSNIFSKGIGKIQEMNMYTEQISRFTEFLSTVENGGSLSEAMYNAAEITLNFKKGGKVTKALDRNGVTFLNASVQGFDKAIRNFTEQKGAKAYVSLMSKILVAGVAPSVINALLYADDDEYEELSDYIKNTYYLFKMDDGTWAKIPKGRLASIFGTAATNVLNLKSDEDAFEGFLSFVVDQVGINNPLENNILSAAIDAYKNTTWYDSDLVSYGMQSLPPSEQYDSSTDSFSIWLGNILDVSPIKINYLLDQYSGIFGDVFLPLLTEEAEENLLISNFTADNANDSKYVGEFYDSLDEYTEKYSSKETPATNEEILTYKYLTTVSSTISDLYKQKDEIQSSNISDKEKLEQVKEIQLEINQITQTAMQNATTGYIGENYASVGEYEYYKNSDGSWTKLSEAQQSTLSEATSSGFSEDEFYTLKNEISLIDSELTSTDTKVEIANIISEYNGTDEEKAFMYSQYYSSEEKTEIITNLGINFDEFLKLDSATIEGEKDNNGNTITGTLKTAYINYVNGLSLTVAKKAMLIKLQYSTFDDYNNEIINYVNNLSKTSIEKANLLTELGFEVSDGGVVSW